MKYWFEELNKFDNPDEAHAKEGKFRQGVAILTLMYLALGKEYPYNMAKNFK